jgi:mono/diheme cytochrome c family protein
MIRIVAMSVRGVISCLVVAQLALAACRAASIPAGEQLSGAAAIGPVPYGTAATQQAAVMPQPMTARDQPLSEAELLALGATIYAVNCAPCHHANGEGNLETFPPLNGNAFVTLRAPGPVIRTVLHGRQLMPAFAPTLDDVEVAATLSYIRNSWNNSASFVNAGQVGEVRTSASEE